MLSPVLNSLISRRRSSGRSRIASSGGGGGRAGGGMMADIWARLRDRMASLDPSTGMIEVTPGYAAHFYDMYVQNHDGKHMTDDRIKILLLKLSFMFRDLILPEIVCSTVTHSLYDVNINWAFPDRLI